MKKLTMSVLLAIAVNSVFAKEGSFEKQSAIQLKAGVYAGGGITMDGNPGVSYPNMLGGNTGAFVRFYIGEHWAVESGLDLYKTETTFGASDIHQPVLYFPTSYSEYSLFAKGYSIPLHIQYHLMSQESMIRPFFSLGFGYSKMSYIRNTTYIDNQSNDVIEFEYVEPDKNMLIQLSQGLTFKLSGKLSLTELSYYKYLPNFGRSEVGFRIGVSYDIVD